jgi:ubiquinone/menaquinone biosynthesis C-methylase UbiE
MKMPFEDNSFDICYEIEATAHAPSKVGVYSEALRVLKPGGIFVGYEWVFTKNVSNQYRALNLVLFWLTIKSDS